MKPSRRFLQQLRRVIQNHPALKQPVLDCLSNRAASRSEFLAFGDADTAAIRRGTLRSLAMRERFWAAVQTMIDGFRRVELTPVSSTTTLRELRSVGHQLITRTSLLGELTCQSTSGEPS